MRAKGDGAAVIGVTCGDCLEGQVLTGFDVEGADEKQFDPKLLATHLETEGLTKAIVALRQFCCGSGAAATHNNTAPRPIPPGSGCNPPCWVIPPS